MARLDRFLQALLAHGGDSLLLVAGQPVRLMHRGVARPVSKEIIDEAQVAALIRELAPPAIAPLLGPQARLSFTYQAPMGLVEVDLAPENGASGATLKFRRPAGASAASAPAEPLVASEPDLGPARDEMERLLRMLAETGASDLHLRIGEPPIMRRDGDLMRTDAAPVTSEQLERMLLSIMTPVAKAEFRDAGDADWAWEIEGVARYRCNAGRDRNGPIAVFRLIPAAIRSAVDLGLTAPVQQLANLSKGLVLVTGPTGSGKSTTLAALIDLVNSSRTDHIITIEDPIEFVHQGKRCLITQRQVGLHTKSFASALRAALREDPDVVLVGELRDLETISIALETAETGHLVFGTLHTTTAPSTLDRIIDQFPPEQQSQVRVMLSESLRGVVAQVLCKKTGGGRVAAIEVLLSIPAVSNLIREGKTFQIPSIMQTNRKIGMVTLNDSLLELVESNQVEPREAWLKAADKTGLLASLKARGHKTDFMTEA
ncbi:MAG TPA: type IV pilus twitching motility protein PilT [Gemmatimonadales bacterium]